jgi:hypothetical protein
MEDAKTQFSLGNNMKSSFYKLTQTTELARIN